METQPKIKEHIMSLLTGELLNTFSIGKDSLKGIYADFETGMVLVTDGSRRTPLLAFSSEEILEMKRRLEHLLHNTFNNPLNKKEVN